MFTHTCISIKYWVIFPLNWVIETSRWHLWKLAKAVFCTVLFIKHLLEVRFLWFEVCSSNYWDNYDVFSFYQRSDFMCHSDCHKMTIWLVRAKTVIALSRLLGGLFWWFKVVCSWLLVYSDISVGSFMSIMSHCDVTLLFKKSGHMKIPTGFDESFPRMGLIFVIWRSQWLVLVLCMQLRPFGRPARTNSYVDSSTKKYVENLWYRRSEL